MRVLFLCAVWEWIKNALQDPEHLAAGLRASQQEAERENSALRERLSIVALN